MMLGENNSSSVERKLEIKLNLFLGEGDTEAISACKTPSKQIETRSSGSRIETTPPDRS